MIFLIVKFLNIGVIMADLDKKTCLLHQPSFPAGYFGFEQKSENSCLFKAEVLRMLLNSINFNDP